MSTNVSGTQWNTSAARLNDGRIAVVWEHDDAATGDGSGSSIRVRIFDPFDPQPGQEFQVNIATTGDQAKPRLTALANGGFAVTYCDVPDPSESAYGYIRIATFDADGTARGEIRLTARSFVFEPTVTELTDGRLLVTWSKEGEDPNEPTSDVRAQIVDPRNMAQSFAGTGVDDQFGGTIYNDVLTGAAGHDRLWGYHGNDTLTGGSGNDILDGGSGTDMAVFPGKCSQYTITGDGKSATVTGEDGTDTLRDIRILRFDDKIVALSNATPTGLSLNRSNSILMENTPFRAEVGTLSATDADGDELTYTLLPGSSSSFDISGNKLVVTGPLDFETQPTHQVMIQASDGLGGVSSLAVSITVTNDIETTPFTIRGTSRADLLSGEAGNDTIFGSSANDTLSGGAGKDIFVFDSRLNKSTNVDKILDFKSKDDSFYLDNKFFTKLGKGTPTKPVKFKSDMFVESTKAKDKEDRIVYDKKTGSLYYDADGTGKTAQVKIATISNKEKLFYHDFFVI